MKKNIYFLAFFSSLLTIQTVVSMENKGTIALIVKDYTQYLKEILPELKPHLQKKRNYVEILTSCKAPLYRATMTVSNEGNPIKLKTALEPSPKKRFLTLLPSFGFNLSREWAASIEVPNSDDAQTLKKMLLDFMQKPDSFPDGSLLVKCCFPQGPFQIKTKNFIPPSIFYNLQNKQFIDIKFITQE
jgi:hypothetical protein